MKCVEIECGEKGVKIKCDLEALPIEIVNKIVNEVYLKTLEAGKNVVVRHSLTDKIIIIILAIFCILLAVFA